MNYSPLAAESSVPPSPKQRCLHSGLCRECLAREQLPISMDFHGFSLSVLYQPPFSSQFFGSLAGAAVQPHGAAGEFLPQPAPSWSCCGIPSQQFTKIPSWREAAEDVPAAQPGGISTTPLFGLLSTDCLKWV